MPTLENTQRIAELLEEFRGIEPLKELFLVELNYNRANISIDNLPESTANLVAEAPFILATGGQDNDFYIIYIQLKAKELRKTDERQIITHLQTRYPDALYVFSNRVQDHWHFVNVKLTREKQEGNEQQLNRDRKQRNIFRRITIAPDERLRTASERIAMLDLENIGKQNTLGIRNGHEKAFKVEAVTKAFFKHYKQVFEQLQTELCDQTGDGKWAHDYAQQFLSRCLFLYFIQRKQWLGEDTEFLHTFWQAYDDSPQLKDTFVEKWLNVLFFEAFNNRFHGGYTYFPTHIRNTMQLAPYLNGGLFRENELDSEYVVNIPDDLWKNIFEFLEGYNFTIAEDTPLDQEVAVDPEMIGIVYESLVSEEEKEKEDAGIFYTQRVEIDLMCRLALVDNLANHIGTESDKHLFYEVLFAFEPEEKMDADAKLTDLWASIYKHLTEITVLDPACGSGSFLVGMLYVLDDLRERAEKYLGINNSESSFERRKEIIGRNLYGVDVKRWACKIAELRLWLALIIEADFDAAALTVRKQNEPLLPDFSFNIRHGDSIVQDIGGLNLTQTRAYGSGVKGNLKHKITKLQDEKLKFYNNDPERKYAEKEEVQEAENFLFRELLQDYDVQIAKEIQKIKVLLEDPAEQLTLPGLKPAESQQLNFETLKMQKELARHEENHAQVQRAREALSSNTTPPFVWDIAFVEIFSQRSGFDVVVENPPYTRQKDIRDLMLPYEEGIKDTNKKAYKAKLKRAIYQVHPDFFGYQSIKDTEPDKPEAATQQKIDANSGLYVYFYFHGLFLLNPKGSFCTITSNSWLDVEYGKNLQEFLLKQCYLKMVLDNSAERSFATADVNTVICLISALSGNQESCLQHMVRFVNFTVPFEAILDAVIFYEIETASARDSSPEYRIHLLSQRSLLVDGNDEKGKYIGDKWGGKYLRAPDIYWVILEKGKDKLVRLGDIVEVRRGFTTGANDFFYLDAEDIQKWGIEAEYLKPVIKNPRECKNISVDPSQLQFKLFMCHVDRAALAGTAALEYIKYGEKEKYHQRETCKGRARWWDLGKRDFADLLWIETMHETFKVHRNAPLIYESDKFYGIKSENNIDTLTALLNSTFMVLFKLLSGFHSLGGGALKTAVYEVKDFRIIQPELLTFNGDLVKVLVQREIGTIQEDTEHNNRRDLDEIVFDVLKLTKNERDGVYEAVIQLVTDRVEKAKNK